jgi:deoxyribonuclease-4
MYIGCHLSSSKGFLAMGKEASSIGANTFQFFTRNPRGGKAKALDEEDAASLNSYAAAHAFGKLVAHAPYTLNACSPDPRIREFARLCFTEDLARMAHLTNSLYIFHPGSHVGQGAEAGIAASSALLDQVLSNAPSATVLIETMAGQGTEIGRTFEEVGELISKTAHNDSLGVCLDTCHVFAAGYDIRDNPDGVLEEFDRVIGLNRLCAVHLNDSVYPLGAHKDRHAAIGKGQIGLEALKRFVEHPALSRLPFILETPNDLAGYAAEILLFQ